MVVCWRHVLDAFYLLHLFACRADDTTPAANPSCSAGQHTNRPPEREDRTVLSFISWLSLFCFTCNLFGDVLKHLHVCFDFWPFLRRCGGKQWRPTQELAGNVPRTAGRRHFLTWTSTVTCPSYAAGTVLHVVMEVAPTCTTCWRSDIRLLLAYWVRVFIAVSLLHHLLRSSLSTALDGFSPHRRHSPVTHGSNSSLSWRVHSRVQWCIFVRSDGTVTGHNGAMMYEAPAVVVS